MSETDSNTAVEYRPVPGFPGYRVGDDGSVWSCWKNNGPRPRIMCDAWKQFKPGKTVKGYRFVALCRGGVIRNYFVHRLVLLAFCDCPDTSLDACHRNGDRNDNSKDNLYWGTRTQNMEDARRHGTMVRGESQGGSKLTESQVIEIRRLCETLSLSAVASQFGIAFQTVSKIKCRKSWAWLEQPTA